MCSDLIVGIELCGNNVISEWRKLIGSADPKKARLEAPHSIRALYGEECPKNADHGSNSRASASRELNFFFNNQS